MATQYIIPTTVTISVSTGIPILVTFARTDFISQLYDDLDNVFYNTGEFAETITYRFRSGESQQIAAIFDEEHSSIDIATEAPVIISEPLFHAHADKFLFRPDRGDSVVIRNREFNVKEAHPDGTGLMVITLLRD